MNISKSVLIPHNSIKANPNASVARLPETAEFIGIFGVLCCSALRFSYSAANLSWAGGWGS